MSESISHAAMRAIQAWQINRMTTFTPANILQEFGNDILRALEIADLIEQLRAPEGASVTLICDNPDFGPAPNSAIEIIDEWTGWKTRRFVGDTVLIALRAARDIRDIETRETKTPYG